MNVLPTSSKHYGLWIQALLCFIIASVILLTGNYDMLLDSDPIWHIAAGDLIRAQGAIPHYDPWSFTAGEYRWLNISWLWDSVFSYIVETLGWDGAVAINAMIIALLFTLIYVHCLLRSHNGIASFLTLVLILTMLPLHLRPVHITHMQVALWMLLLGLFIRDECRARWLALLPACMLLWVNMHGGFILGFALTGVFWLQTLWQRQTKKSWQLCMVLIASSIAALCNPYGIYIVEAVARPLFSVGNDYISEWHSYKIDFMFIINGLFVILFIALVVGRRTCATPAEKWLAYAFLVYGLTTSRVLTVFAIIAAPMLAYKLADYCKESSEPSETALKIRSWAMHCIHHRNTLLISVVIACGTVCILPSPLFLKHFPQQTSWPHMREEIAFIKEHYPNGRFINDFVLGGYILYETKGTLPVFVDARTETAYPSQVMRDYFDFRAAAPGWENIIKKYRINGIILPNEAEQQMHTRFGQRKGWEKAFTGKDATIYVRISNEVLANEVLANEVLANEVLANEALAE